MATNNYVKILTTFQVASDQVLTDARANWSEYVTEATTGSNAAKISSGKTSIADSGSFSVPFGAVTTAKYLWLKTDRQVTLKFNGASTGFLLGTAAAASGFMGIPTSCTSLTVENGSGAAVEVEFELVGV
jgi:hypothetical protein